MNITPEKPYVTLLSALQDNYIYLYEDPTSQMLAVIDPGEAAPVIAAMEAHHLAPAHILLTHHHWDHVGGVAELKAKYGCYVWGPEAEAEKIGGIDAKLCHGDHVRIGDTRFKVLETPGHTQGHISYYAEEPGIVFCGDALFGLGCGRLFEGTPAQMWQSLQRLRDLPDETLAYCGHEYTRNNLEFAASLDDPEAEAALAARREKLTENPTHPSIPFTLADEKAGNPFLRADQRSLAEAIGQPDARPVEVFSEIRRRRDHW